MELSSRNVPVARRWAQNLYLILAIVNLLSIFLQGFLIGVYLFSGEAWAGSAHGIMGLLLFVFSLLLAVVGLFGQVSGKIKIWGFLFFVLMIIQIILPSSRGGAPLIAALHPVLAMFLFGLNLYLIFHTWQGLRASRR